MDRVTSIPDMSRSLQTIEHSVSLANILAVPSFTKYTVGIRKELMRFNQTSNTFDLGFSFTRFLRRYSCYNLIPISSLILYIVLALLCFLLVLPGSIHSFL